MCLSDVFFLYLLITVLYSGSVVFLSAVFQLQGIHGVLHICNCSIPKGAISDPEQKQWCAARNSHGQGQDQGLEKSCSEVTEIGRTSCNYMAYFSPFFFTFDIEVTQHDTVSFVPQKRRVKNNQPTLLSLF
jgi:hypothetical protein